MGLIKNHSTASQAALFSLLNLTLLPVIGFLVLLWRYHSNANDSLTRYYVKLGIKTNLLAGLLLLGVSTLVIQWGGSDNGWTWVIVISYFTLVHSGFILFASWCLIRAWSGKRLFHPSELNKP